MAAAGRRDLDLGQAEQPVVDPGREVDGAHLVEPRGRRLLREQAPPQLDLAVGDAVAGGQPPQDAEGDDERDGIQLPPVVAVGAGPEDDDRQQCGKEADQRLERVDEQHPGVEPAPAVGVLAHVASPVSATAAAVRASTSSWATGRSSPWMVTGPAADAVVMVTEARPEQLGDGAALEVDRLHPAERGDAALLPEPAALGVDRARRRLPTVHAVAPLRHGDGVGGAGDEPDRADDPVRRARGGVVDEPPHDLPGEQHGEHDDGLDRPHEDGAARDPVRRLAEHGLPVNGHVGWFHGPTVPHDPDGRSEAYGGCRERARHGRRTPRIGQEHHRPPRTAAGRLSMPLNSVEAVLDTDTDTQVRREWTALADAGLPSQAGHQWTTNAPHLTLSAAGSVPDVVEARVVTRWRGCDPCRCASARLLVMGSRRFVLARLVVPTAQLLALHQAVADAMVAAPDVPERVRVDRWTPHVTLARGLAVEQVGAALAVLGTVPPLDGTIESVRRWDPDAGRTWVVGGIPTMGP